MKKEKFRHMTVPERLGRKIDRTMQCERIHSTGNMVAQCKNKAEYVYMEFGFVFCRKCAHEIAKKNDGYRIVTFKRIE